VVVLLLLMAVIVTAHLREFLSALGASACPGGPDCYPWGSEGPEGRWPYASKQNYLLFAGLRTCLAALWGLLTFLFVMERMGKRSWLITSLASIALWMGLGFL
jgi:hypothetical protein